MLGCEQIKSALNGLCSSPNRMFRVSVILVLETLLYCSDGLMFFALGVLHSTEVAFLLLTQQPRVRIPALPRFFPFC